MTELYDITCFTHLSISLYSPLRPTTVLMEEITSSAIPPALLYSSRSKVEYFVVNYRKYTNTCFYFN